MTELPNTETNDEIEQEIRDNQEKIIRKLAEQKAKKYLSKNHREIQRLKDHAEECLHVCNKDGYIYSIEKLRKLTMQKPIGRDVLESLWASSKQRYDELVMEAYQKVKETPVNASGESKGDLTPVCSI